MAVWCKIARQMGWATTFVLHRGGAGAYEMTPVDARRAITQFAIWPRAPEPQVIRNVIGAPMRDPGKGDPANAHCAGSRVSPTWYQRPERCLEPRHWRGSTSHGFTLPGRWEDRHEKCGERRLVRLGLRRTWYA